MSLILQRTVLKARGTCETCGERLHVCEVAYDVLDHTKRYARFCRHCMSEYAYREFPVLKRVDNVPSSGTAVIAAADPSNTTPIKAFRKAGKRSAKVKSSVALNVNAKDLFLDMI